MNLKPMSLNQNRNKEKTNDIYSNLPSWVYPDALSAKDFKFKIYKENVDAVYEAVKTSSLPQDIIEYLTKDGTFSGMLLRSGFAMHTENLDLKGYADAFFFCECLGEYTKDFLHIIAPFVEADSYLLVEGFENDGSGFESHKWVFDGNTCDLVFPYNIVVGKTYGQY